MHKLLETLAVDDHPSGTCGASGWHDAGSAQHSSVNPATGESLALVSLATSEDYERVVTDAEGSFEKWRNVPAPVRGQVVRSLGEKLRDHREALGELVSLETGKIRAEGIGEVQEMIDICDFAVGLSRQLCGKTMHSERPGHRMYEQYHPLGPVGIISAFNFPVAVWAWNAAIAAVCGDTMVWKPSLQAPLTAIAVQRLCNEVMAEHDCHGVFNLVIGTDLDIAEPMVADRRFPLLSFTGSCAVGRQVAGTVAARMGRSLLELGGNNALIVEPDADLALATRAIVFGAIGTAGQRCTSTRRLIVHRTIETQLLDRLRAAYAQVVIGDPLDPKTLMGPLISEAAVNGMGGALESARLQGGEVVIGGKSRAPSRGFFVNPAVVAMKSQTAQVREEVFAPILYSIPYDTLDHAIAIQNDVPQGLSSAIFTRSLQAAERFLASIGSDCGIANVNIGTSGAEIGGAFGGEKDTGGGREAGSDSWKVYMRRQTNTINWSGELPLAQGISFDVAG